MTNPKNELVQRRWRLAAESGFPFKITFDITKGHFVSEDSGTPYIPMTFARHRLLKEVESILGERRVNWRQCPIDPDSKCGEIARKTLIIFSADDDWLVQAKLLGARLVTVPITVEKWNDDEQCEPRIHPNPVHSDAQ